MIARILSIVAQAETNDQRAAVVRVLIGALANTLRGAA